MVSSFGAVLGPLLFCHVVGWWRRIHRFMGVGVRMHSPIRESNPGPSSFRSDAFLSELSGGPGHTFRLSPCLMRFAPNLISRPTERLLNPLSCPKVTVLDPHCVPKCHWVRKCAAVLGLEPETFGLPLQHSAD